jgi:hypothetical protein
VHETAVPTVPVVGQLIVTARGDAGPIVTVADWVLVAEFASVAVTEMVLLPLVE